MKTLTQQPSKRNVRLAAVCVLGAIVSWRFMDYLGPSEFRGGTVTRVVGDRNQQFQCGPMVASWRRNDRRSGVPVNPNFSSASLSTTPAILVSFTRSLSA
jgi:hypothetical protein